MLYFYNMLPTEENIDYVFLNHANVLTILQERKEENKLIMALSLRTLSKPCSSYIPVGLL